MDNKTVISSILKDTSACAFHLSDYSYNERLAYVSMIVSLAWADGSIDDRERRLINTIAQAAGKDIVDELESIIIQNRKFSLEKYNEWVDNIRDEKLKVGLIIDMFLTSFADKILMQSETIYMKYISQKLGISQPLYTEIRKCVEEILNYKDDEQQIRYEYGPLNNREKQTNAPTESLLGKYLKDIANSFIALF
ncbi:MAG: TerB family tellurite resistance protein [Bacteroidales bacterium]|nr:TerB family tellurite resistance protein [Bacteroidales bacterium]